MSARGEFRVVWKRVGCRPKTKRFGARATAERFMRLFGPDPWIVFADKGKDSDSLICCSGYQCGCGGLTYRQQSEEQRANQPGLESIRLETRPLGPWTGLPSETADAAVISDGPGRA